MLYLNKILTEKTKILKRKFRFPGSAREKIYNKFFSVLRPFSLDNSTHFIWSISMQMVLRQFLFQKLENRRKPVEKIWILSLSARRIFRNSLFMNSFKHLFNQAKSFSPVEIEFCNAEITKSVVWWCHLLLWNVQNVTQWRNRSLLLRHFPWPF